VICVDLNKGCPEKLCGVINYAEMRMTVYEISFTSAENQQVPKCPDSLLATVMPLMGIFPIV